MINISLFSQIIQQLPKDSFSSLVKKYDSDKHSKGINSWTHLITMMFCHLAKVNSLRDISTGMQSISGNLNHLGVGKAPSKSSISYLNESRDWKLFRDFYFALLDHFQAVHNFKRTAHRKLKRKIFILDSTTISLCLSVFDWATFRQRKGAIKLHTVLDFDGCLPVFVDMTVGKKHDVAAAKEITFPSGSILVMDKGYIDYQWLFNLDSNNVYFVTRAKDNMDYEVVADYEIPEKERGFILEDKDIRVAGFYSARKLPKTMRLVKIYDEDMKREITFLTNNRSWTASTVAALYKSRWEIEIFFKQIKQHVKITSFIGTTENAVLIQVWTALITMLMVKFLKEKAKYKWHLSNLITFLRLNLLVKINLWEWLNKPFMEPAEYIPEQLIIDY
jgi:hypothetical protein